MSENFQNTLIAIIALIALCFVLCGRSKAAEPHQLPFVRPIPITRPAPTPTYPTPRLGGTRQLTPTYPAPRVGAELTPTYPAPRVGAELSASGHSFSFSLHARF